MKLRAALQREDAIAAARSSLRNAVATFRGQPHSSSSLSTLMSIIVRVQDQPEVCRDEQVSNLLAAANAAAAEETRRQRVVASREALRDAIKRARREQLTSGLERAIVLAETGSDDEAPALVDLIAEARQAVASIQRHHRRAEVERELERVVSFQLEVERLLASGICETRGKMLYTLLTLIVQVASMNIDEIESEEEIDVAEERLENAVGGCEAEGCDAACAAFASAAACRLALHSRRSQLRLSSVVREVEEKASVEMPSLAVAALEEALSSARKRGLKEPDKFVEQANQQLNQWQTRAQVVEFIDRVSMGIASFQAAIRERALSMHQSDESTSSVRDDSFQMPTDAVSSATAADVFELISTITPAERAAQELADATLDELLTEARSLVRAAQAGQERADVESALAEAVARCRRTREPQSLQPAIARAEAYRGAGNRQSDGSSSSSRMENLLDEAHTLLQELHQEQRRGEALANTQDALAQAQLLLAADAVRRDDIVLVQGRLSLATADSLSLGIGETHPVLARSLAAVRNLDVMAARMPLQDCISVVQARLEGRHEWALAQMADLGLLDDLSGASGLGERPGMPTGHDKIGSAESSFSVTGALVPVEPVVHSVVRDEQETIDAQSIDLLQKEMAAARRHGLSCGDVVFDEAQRLLSRLNQRCFAREAVADVRGAVQAFTDGSLDLVGLMSRVAAVETRFTATEPSEGCTFPILEAALDEARGLIVVC